MPEKKQVSTAKLKKQSGALERIELIENPDIIQSVASHTHRPTLVIGFAAETDEIATHAREKRARKGLDAIVANDVSQGQVFGQDHTACRLLDHQGGDLEVSGTKSAVADALLTHLLTL